MLDAEEVEKGLAMAMVKLRATIGQRLLDLHRAH